METYSSKVKKGLPVGPSLAWAGLPLVFSQKRRSEAGSVHLGGPKIGGSSSTSGRLCKHGNQVCMVPKTCPSEDAAERRRFFGYWTWRCYEQRRERQGVTTTGWKSSGDVYSPGPVTYGYGSGDVRPHSPAPAEAQAPCVPKELRVRRKRRVTQARARVAPASSVVSSDTESSGGAGDSASACSGEVEVPYVIPPPVDAILLDLVELTKCLSLGLAYQHVGDRVRKFLGEALVSQVEPISPVSSDMAMPIVVAIPTASKVKAPQVGGPSHQGGDITGPVKVVSLVKTHLVRRVDSRAIALCEVDDELYNHLRLEALFEVRSAELPLKLKRKATKYLEGFDQRNLTEASRVDMVHRAVVAAMVPSPDEVTARHVYRCGAAAMHAHADLMAGDISSKGVVEAIGDWIQDRPQNLPCVA